MTSSSPRAWRRSPERRSISTRKSCAAVRRLSASRSRSLASARKAGRIGCRPCCGRRSDPSTIQQLGWSRPMQGDVVNSVPLGGAVPHDLSIVSLFLQADFIVKIVMFLLLAASFWSWAVIFDKIMKLRRLRRDAVNFEESFWSGGSLDDLYDRIGARPLDPMSAVFAAAMREWRRSAAKGLVASTALRTNLQERLERFMAFLATVGSTAPFVGLFGTVWGIMNSFQSIAASKNTSLAVVAPGIAEALFSTLLGLVAAIPAVIAYNKLSTDFGRYAGRLEAFSSEFSAILSRQLDERP